MTQLISNRREALQLNQDRLGPTKMDANHDQVPEMGLGTDNAATMNRQEALKPNQDCLGSTKIDVGRGQIPKMGLDLDNTALTKTLLTLKKSNFGPQHGSSHLECNGIEKGPYPSPLDHTSMQDNKSPNPLFETLSTLEVLSMK